MRGSDARTGSLFAYVDIEAKITRDHPLRLIREVVNAALAQGRRDTKWCQIKRWSALQVDSDGLSLVGWRRRGLTLACALTRP
jgi:hypothetical protein